MRRYVQEGVAKAQFLGKGIRSTGPTDIEGLP